MFNLTSNERRAFLFLAAMYIIGLSVSFLAKKIAPGKREVFFNENLGKVGLNTADKEVLMRIPGIGEKLSQRIISFRQDSGEFNSLEELKKVQGITEGKFNRIKEYLTL